MGPLRTLALSKEASLTRAQTLRPLETKETLIPTSNLTTPILHSKKHRTRASITELEAISETPEDKQIQIKIGSKTLATGNQDFLALINSIARRMTPSIMMQMNLMRGFLLTSLSLKKDNSITNHLCRKTLITLINTKKRYR